MSRLTDREWLQQLKDACAEIKSADLTSLTAPSGNVARHASVLLLFTDAPGAGAEALADIPSSEPEVVSAPTALPHVLLLERAHDMRSHAGQIAFPGGAQDSTDQDAVAAALREAQEETGLDPRGVEVVGVLPTLWLPPSNFEVTPVVGFWRTPGAVHAVDPAETASVHLVALDALLDSDNRVTIRHFSGRLGPAFLIDELIIWGFTAGLLSRLSAKCGWERPWNESRIIALPDEMIASSRRDHHPAGTATMLPVEVTG